MTEALLAILLVTSSAKGSSLVFRWPPLPVASPRLARPLLHRDASCKDADNPWRAANQTDDTPDVSRTFSDHEANNDDDDEYLWRRPNVARERRSSSFSRSRSHPASRRESPSKDPNESITLDNQQDLPVDGDFTQILGYSVEVLAGLLCPQRAMCHQKFELIVDDLAFIGHPVSAEADGTWRFKQDKSRFAARGRGSKKGQSPQGEEKSLTPERQSRDKRPAPDSSWLQTFHLVIVLDLPDPSSSASGNLAKYFDTIYEQIAFTITAVLYQEQVLYNFVEAECDTLGTLKDDCISKGRSFADYVTQALRVSSIASAMKTLYEAMKTRVIARLTIHEFSLELQLPPFLEQLLRNDDPSDSDTGEREAEDGFEFGDSSSWGPEMSFGWKLPALTPWKSLLRLDDEDERGYELHMKLKGQLREPDRELAEQLLKFLDLASVTLSLADMASLLDWDLESQVFPTVRWLVHHRRAKLVDMVHPGLRTVFTVPPELSAPLSTLSADFERAFPHPSIPPLPKILSAISTATHETANHFYASVVREKDLIPVYHDVIVWMLKRDLLITLHLRIRVVATPALRERVRRKRESALARRGRARARAQDASIGDGQELKRSTFIGEKESRTEDSQTQGSDEGALDSSPVDYWLSMSPKSARLQTRQLSAILTGNEQGETRELKTIQPVKGGAEEDDEEEEDDDDEIALTQADDTWHEMGASIISDPGRATPLERQWLAAMSDGKNVYLARRFEQINQYFDGKCTDDEILYRADISRRQLREVLHHYDEYLLTFLHPS